MLKKLKIKIKKKRKRYRKTPQNCKSPTQRQMFITTMKNVTKKKKSLVGFHSANKIDNYNRGGKRNKNPKFSTEQVKK